jgi:DNA-binding protein HU-beta
MNKTELTDAVADATGLTKADAARALDAVLTSISDALAKGEQVGVVGFGTFLVRERAARTGRNPQTGAEIQIAAAKVPAFKPGKALKDAVN